MSLETVPAERTDQEKIIDLLGLVFRVGPDSQLADARLLGWKIFSAPPGSELPKGYLIKKNGSIVAYAGFWPLSLLTLAGPVPCGHAFDWAARPESVGAGVLLFKRLVSMAETMICIGGAPAARRILPSIGFRVVGQLDHYARVVRPWSQFLSHTKNWKAPLRLARNTVWSLRPLAAVPRPWSSQPVRELQTSHRLAVDRQPVAAFTTCRRSIAMMNYLLACPVAEMSAHIILRGEQLRGNFLLARLGGQTRIADLWVQSESAAEWSVAFSLAARAAANLCQTCEVTASASVDCVRTALEQNGFRKRGSDPVLFSDPGRRLHVGPPLHLNLADGDLFFLHDPGWPYLT